MKLQALHLQAVKANIFSGSHKQTERESGCWLFDPIYPVAVRPAPTHVHHALRAFRTILLITYVQLPNDLQTTNKTLVLHGIKSTEIWLYFYVLIFVIHFHSQLISGEIKAPKMVNSAWLQCHRTNDPNLYRTTRRLWLTILNTKVMHIIVDLRLSTSLLLRHTIVDSLYYGLNIWRNISGSVKDLLQRVGRKTL